MTANWSAMASFSVPCQKTTTVITASQQNEKMNQQQQQQQQQHCSVSFQGSSPALLAGSSLRFKGSRHNQSDVFRVFSQLNDVAIKKSSNSAPVSDTKSDEPVKESAAKNTVPDAASISAFMTQVADIVELVDSRDITELQLKQLGCELIIRKKEALQQQSVASPIVRTQPPSPQLLVPSRLLPAPVSASASAGPVSSPPASGLVPPNPGKPKSSHPPLKCPMAGTFYRSPAPGAPPFVKVGDKVQKGQVVCIIEAMKLMNEIEADQSGTVVEILVDDVKPVSVNTPLFVIKP